MYHRVKQTEPFAACFLFCPVVEIKTARLCRFVENYKRPDSQSSLFLITEKALFFRLKPTSSVFVRERFAAACHSTWTQGLGFMAMQTIRYREESYGNLSMEQLRICS